MSTLITSLDRKFIANHVDIIVFEPFFLPSHRDRLGRRKNIKQNEFSKILSLFVGLLDQQNFFEKFHKQNSP